MGPSIGDHVTFHRLEDGAMVEGVVVWVKDNVGHGFPGFIADTSEGRRWAYDGAIVSINGEEVA